METTYRVRIMNPGNTAGNFATLFGSTCETPALAKEAARVEQSLLLPSQPNEGLLLGLERTEWRVAGQRLERERTTLVEMESTSGEWEIPVRFQFERFDAGM